jgi:hypothetical protein
MDTVTAFLSTVVSFISAIPGINIFFSGFVGSIVGLFGTIIAVAASQYSAHEAAVRQSAAEDRARAHAVDLEAARRAWEDERRRVEDQQREKREQAEREERQLANEAALRAKVDKDLAELRGQFIQLDSEVREMASTPASSVRTSEADGPPPHDAEWSRLWDRDRVERFTRLAAVVPDIAARESLDTVILLLSQLSRLAEPWRNNPIRISVHARHLARVGERALAAYRRGESGVVPGAELEGLQRLVAQADSRDSEEMERLVQMYEQDQANQDAEEDHENYLAEFRLLNND